MARNEDTFQQTLTHLKKHAADPVTLDIRAAFANDPQRFDKFSLVLDDLLLDFSKCAVHAKTLDLLSDLAKAADVFGHRDAMFEGQPINTTEQRSVLHIALRAPKEEAILLDGHNIVDDVQDVLTRMEAFVNSVRSGDYKGEKGHAITDVVNIGIGGSDLGPAMATLALKPYHGDLRCHFVSNVDGAHIADILAPLDPQTTLIIVSSKTFTTAETMANALVARQWVANAMGNAAVRRHFVAVSTALDKVADFGIDPSLVFGFWNWVGGRYSVWSAVGLSLMMAIGPEQFRQFLAGAHAMDKHFKEAPIVRNLPIMLGLIGFWHRVVCGYPSRAIIPYEQRLSRLPAYLQQLDMESNGKSITLTGDKVKFSSGPVVWGEPGTNGQHAFFQLIHQGTDIIPVEFIAAVNGHEVNLNYQHDMLIANCLAQGEALMMGRTADAVKKRLEEQGMEEADAQALCAHKSFSGNRPTVTIFHDILSPFALGRLLALYEHRVFVEGVLMNINSFDQWGVELGKELANELLPMVAGKVEAEGRDSSTLGLLAHLKTRKANS